MSLLLGVVLAQAQTPLPARPSMEPKPIWHTSPAVIESTYEVVPTIDAHGPRARTTPVPVHPLAHRLRLGRTSSSSAGAPAPAPFGGLTVARERAPAGSTTGFEGIGQTPWVPPDPTLAVGPAHIVETVNMQIAFYTKAGVLEFTQNLDSTGSPGFFEGVGGGDFCFDPKCLYDPHSGRFVVVALERYVGTEEGYIDIAVSDDSDPNGTWFKYRTDDVTNVGGVDFWVDYPGLGVDEDAIYVTGDLFDFSDSFTAGVKYRIFDKTPLLSGAAAVYGDLLDSTSASVQCTHAFDSGLQPFCVSVASTSEIRLQSITDPLGTPALVTEDVSVPAFILPDFFADTVPNLSGCGIEALDGRILNVALRDGSLHATHAIKSGTKIVARWYEFDLGSWPTSGTPTLVQSGNIDAGGAVYTWFPAIMSNACGETGVILARSSASEFAGIAYTGRRSGDAPGTMTVPLTTLATGTSGYCDFRWGDYFGIAVDPSDERTFWGIGQYAVDTSTWQTWIASFSLNRVPAFAGATPCGSTLVVKAGTPLTYSVSAADPDPCDSVTLSVAGPPAGALHVPALPLIGVAPSTTLSWTPGILDVGTHVLTYTITDGVLATSCPVTILVQAKIKQVAGPPQPE